MGLIIGAGRLYLGYSFYIWEQKNDAPLDDD